MKHKIFTFLLAVMASVGMSFAETYSGSCGENLTWSLNTEDSVLTISGTGAMADYESYTATLWYSNRESIKSIVIKEGVTSIGKHAFCSLNNLTSVTISNSVTVIGNYAFGSNVINGCSGLTAVHISDLAAWCNINFSASTSNPLYYAKNLYLNGTLVEELVIPDGITKINDYAFYNCSSLTSVTIPNSVTSIGKNAFINCKSMVSVTIPNGVTSIGSSAFVGCSSLNAVNISDLAAWCNISFSAASSNPLNNAKNLYLNGILVEKIVIPNGVTKINDYTFYNCSSLTSVTIRNGVTSIGNSAFYGCSSMTAVTIPSSVTTIGSSAFGGCSSLTAVNIYDLAAWCNISFKASSSNPLYYAKNLYLNGTLVKDLVIPNGVTKINDYAFSNCSSLTSATIPNSVTSIGTYSFYGCSSMTSITIPNGVTSIGNSAFYKCSGLTSVTIPSSITTIESNAFNGCSSLTAVNISDLAAWCNINFSASTSNPLYYAKNLYLNGTLVEELVIPNGVSKINNCTFYNCSSLTSVAIPNSVTTIGSYAFSGCSGLTSVTIPNSVDSIGTNAFRECTGITSLTISNSVTTIESAAFWGCTGLTSITNLATTPQAVNTYVFGNLASNTAVDYSVCTLYVPAESVEAYKAADVWKEFTNILPIGESSDSCVIASGTCGAEGDNLTWTLSCDSVLTISGTGAMTYPSTQLPWHSKKEYIKSVVIENGVTSIAFCAFYADYSALTSVTIPNSVTNIGALAFAACTSLNSIEIPNSVTDIGQLAFYDCSSLKSVIIPNSVTNIGYGPFVGCTGLTSLTVETDNTNYCSLDGVMFSKDKTVLIQCPGGKQGAYMIPNGVANIALAAFEKCSSLTSIEIPNTVTNIGNEAFASCTSLTSVVIPNSVVSIGEDVFKYCSYLTSIDVASDNPNYSSIDGVLFNKEKTTLLRCPNGNTRTEYTIPDGVTTIGQRSFESCWQLNSIIIPDGVTTIEANAFEGCVNLTSVSIANSVSTIENEAFLGCQKLTSVTNYAANPQTIAATAFSFANQSSCTLYVPAESVEAYKAADGWKEFTNILPIGGYPEVNDTLTIAEAIQIGMALDSMETSVEIYTIEGYVINAGTFYKGSKDQSWYMADDAEATSSDFQAYRCYPIDGTDTVEVHNGAKVRMTGKLQKYYNRSTGKYIVEMTYTPAIILSTPVQAPLDTITVAEALAIGATLADNAATAKQYVIRGYVSSVSPYVEQYGYQNFYIADEPNSTANSNAAGGFYVYRGIPSTGTAVTVGNLVELTCAVRKYVSLGGTNTNIENSEYPIPVTVLQVDTMPCVLASGTCGAEGDNLTWTLTCDSVLTISGTGKMADYSSSLDQSWYAYSEAIKSVIIGNGVTSIGRLAFYSFISLTSIEIPNSVTSIGEYAFGYCSMGSSGSMYSVTIPNSVTSIGNYAFFGCHSLTSVTIPNSVTSIGNFAFAFCSGLTAINVDTDNPKYTSIDGVLFNNNKKLLKQYPGGRQGTYTIPSSVTNIGTAAFAYSKGLTSIEIPNSVTSIGEYAFWEARGLTSVTIPNSVINIGEYAFANFRSLTSVTNYATAPQAIDTTTFNNVDKSACTLYVPAESLEAYKTANGWKEFTNILPIGGTTPPQESDREGQSTEGKDFWVTFMQADQDPNNDLVLSLSISSRENCQVQISNPYTGYMETVNVTANQMQLVELYSGNVLLANARTTMANSGKVCYAGYSEQVDTCALRVTATSDISLFATNYKRATFDATNVLPTALLGDEYFIQTYSPSDHGGNVSQGSHFAIVATEDNTIVDYCPTVMTERLNDVFTKANSGYYLTPEDSALLYYKAGDILSSPVLMAGQVFYVWTGKKDGDAGDLSGTHVKARDGKRIAVFQGNPHTNVPYMIKQRDQLYSQAMPVRYWGNTFALTASATRPSDIIRVMAVHDGTEVYINGEPVHTFDFTVDTKHFWEFEIGPSGTYAQEGSCMLATSHPVGVHLFLTSQQYKGDKNSNGDPAMMWVSPIEHQMEQVNIATYSGINAATTSYVNVVTDKPEVMTLDGASITSNFSPVSGSNTYYYAQITLGTTAASHTLKSNGGKFNAHVYGFSSNESYAYSAGSFIEDHTISVIINGNEFTSEGGMMEWCVRDTFLLDIITTNCQVSQVDYGDGTVETFHFTDGVSVDSLYTKHAYSKPGLYQATVSVTYTLNTTDTFLTVYPLRIYAGLIDLEYEPLGDIYVGDSIFYIYYHTPLQDMKIDEDFVMNRFFNSAALEDGFGKMSTRLNKSFFGIRIPETARAGVEYAFGVNVETPCETFTVEIPFVLKNRRTGTCGDNNALTWTYDPETKTLTISGNGTLNSNYTFGPEAPTEMEQLIIAEGVTSIGDSAFRNMSTLQTMQLPASLKTIGAKAFENCINLTSIYNYRERPCLVDATAFDGVNKFDCTLYVLEGSVEMYKSAASDWKDFYFILPISTTTVTEPVSDVTVEPHDNSATVTWPAQDNAVTYTIEISKDGVVFCRLTFNAYGQLTGIAFAPGRGGAHNAPAAVMTANGLQFTVTGLNSNTQYGYNITTRDSNDAAIATYSGKFTTTGGGGVTTGVDNVQGKDVQCTKVIRNGQIYILRGEKVYTVTGEEVR